jgi:hypothetical protein
MVGMVPTNKAGHVAMYTAQSKLREANKPFTALVSSWLALSPSAIHPFRAVSYYIRRFIQYCHFALRGPIVVRKKKAIEQHIVGLNCTSHHFNASFINSFNIPGSPRRGPWFPGSYTTTYRLRCINDNDNKYKI